MARFTEKMIEHIMAGIRNIVAPADEDQAKTLAAVAEAKAMADAFGSDQEERLSKKKKKSFVRRLCVVKQTAIHDFMPPNTFQSILKHSKKSTKA